MAQNSQQAQHQPQRQHQPHQQHGRDHGHPHEELPFDTYMVVVAHPDDLEFSSGGTVAKLAATGKRVVLVQVTSGDRGTSDRTIRPEQLVAIREEEEREAARRLGIAEIVFLRYPDGEVPNDLRLRGDITRMIRTHKPDVVITHDGFRPYALHPDHRHVGLATTDAIYPSARDPWAYPDQIEAGLETWKVAEIWYFGPEHPDKYVDITESFEKKIEALKAHHSQVGHSDGWIERVAERCREVAKDKPFEMAEAFKVVQLRR
jgi:LmbE family N-acetylglucosaminyl deacetylase